MTDLGARLTTLRRSPNAPIAGIIIAVAWTAIVLVTKTASIASVAPHVHARRIPMLPRL